VSPKYSGTWIVTRDSYSNRLTSEDPEYRLCLYQVSIVNFNSSPLYPRSCQEFSKVWNFATLKPYLLWLSNTNTVPVTIDPTVTRLKVMTQSVSNRHRYCLWHFKCHMSNFWILWSFCQAVLFVFPKRHKNINDKSQMSQTRSLYVALLSLSANFHVLKLRFARTHPEFLYLPRSRSGLEFCSERFSHSSHEQWHWRISWLWKRKKVLMS